MWSICKDSKHSKITTNNQYGMGKMAIEIVQIIHDFYCPMKTYFIPNMIIRFEFRNNFINFHFGFYLWPRKLLGLVWGPNMRKRMFLVFCHSFEKNNGKIFGPISRINVCTQNISSFLCVKPNNCIVIFLTTNFFVITFT